ncbi:DUF554 domain-containing protein [Xanthovirga aplysinae]|uniref:DUF554 domain-containing protein n=1 Tax=Xanthovirga aplysinae TaxID=2529853 RepID=UPI0012BBA97E|nr:DUF554 domain-containing protein [Xanthovirga aplysinae]MTI29900.1 DUF554 domain-containing protein [Xanthovirga aplysinae]
MFLPLGSLANVAAILAGGVLGLFLNDRFPENIRKISFQGIGLCVMLIGVQMALKVENVILMIFSVLIGGIIGEALNLDTRFKNMADKLKRRLKSNNEKFSDGLITAFMLYCIGSMAVLGALDEGLRNDPSILYTKAILDGFTSIILASIYGRGVLFSVIPLFIYQAGLTFMAGFIEPFLSPVLLNEIAGTGGLLIIGLSISVLEIKEIRVTNMLPALVMVVVLNLFFG